MRSAHRSSIVATILLSVESAGVMVTGKESTATAVLPLHAAGTEGVMRIPSASVPQVGLV